MFISPQELHLMVFDVHCYMGQNHPRRGLGIDVRGRYHRVESRMISHLWGKGPCSSLG